MGLDSQPRLLPSQPTAAQVVEGPGSWTMRLRVSMVGFTHNYSESFDKSGKESSWFMRRDMRVGGSAGQLFFTADGRAVLRCAQLLAGRALAAAFPRDAPAPERVPSAHRLNLPTLHGCGLPHAQDLHHRRAARGLL